MEPLPAIPRVSAVVTAYNVGPYIARAIDSALAVDWPADHLEIVVVDDGSTDETPEILRGYGDRIRVISQPNRGFNAAMSAGIEAATGDVIAILDGDDEWPADKLRVQVGELCARPELGLVHGDMELIDVDGNTIHPSFFARENLPLRRGRVLSQLLTGNFVSGGASVIRADLRARFCPIPADAAFPDWYIAVRIAEVAEIDHVDVSVNRYRQHGANMGLGQQGEKLVDGWMRGALHQRWMLRNLDLAQVPTETLVAAQAILWSTLVGVAAHRGTRPGTLLEIDDADRAAARDTLAAAGGALRRCDLDGALRAAVIAFGHDPFNGEARCAIEAFQHRAAQLAARPAQPAPVTRTHAVLADARELLADPELLRAWADTFGAGDDVTLVLVAPPDDLPAVWDGLTAVAATAGLEGDDAPDVVVHACADPADARIVFAAVYGADGDAETPEMSGPQTLAELRACILGAQAQRV